MDPLVGQAWAHPALSLTYDISSDIFQNLFQSVFDHPVFVRWSAEIVDWHLYCVGEPGAGKTTLAAIITQRLRKRFEFAGHSVIPIFIREDVTIHEHEFLEDFLHSVYQSLGEWKACHEDRSKKFYEEYVKARFGLDEGCRINRRLALIHESLHRRLEARSKDSRVFLIIDGIDLCGQTLLLLLEAELSKLRVAGVSMLLTSRIPIFEQDVSRCDHPKHREFGDEVIDDSEEPLEQFDRQIVDMFYTCENCLSILCLPCKALGRTCEANACTMNGPLREMYDHVNITLSIPDDDMEAYIAWSLEREHGDIGLNSSARKPPLSSLGLSIRKDKDTGLATTIVGNIRGLSSGHVATAKARLDLVHDAHSVEEVLQKRYQLPANIVAMFDAAIRAVEAQTPFQRSLGLQAIAAAGRGPDGIEIAYLRELLNRCNTVKVRSGEDILRAARGLLTAPVGFKPQSLYIFEKSFYNYVFERYNESIYHADLQLPQDDSSEQAERDSPTLGRVVSECQAFSEEPTPITTPGTDVVERGPDGQAFSPSYIVRKGTRMWM